MTGNPKQTKAFTVGFFALVPWLIWYGVLLIYRRSVRLGKVPGDYDGWCIKPNGYKMKCSLEHWLEWDPQAGIAGILMFMSALVAAAVSGWILLGFLRQLGPRVPKP